MTLIHTKLLDMQEKRFRDREQKRRKRFLQYTICATSLKLALHNGQSQTSQPTVLQELISDIRTMWEAL